MQGQSYFKKENISEILFKEPDCSDSVETILETLGKSREVEGAFPTWKSPTSLNNSRCHP